MKKTTLTFMGIILLALLASCSTTEPAATQIDIRPDVQRLFDARPNNEQIDLIPADEIDTIMEIVWNSHQYQMAWERWEDYAVTLEDYISGLSEHLMAI